MQDASHRPPQPAKLFQNLNGSSPRQWMMTGRLRLMSEAQDDVRRNPTRISRHKPDFTRDMLGEIEILFQHYRDLLLESGFETTAQWPYAYDRFDNGVKIPDVARRLYARLGSEVKRFGNPFHAAGPGSFFHWLNSGVDGEQNPASVITRVWHEAYHLRPDVQEAFPDLFNHDRSAFLKWVKERGIQETGLDERFLVNRERGSQIEPAEAPKPTTPESPAPNFGVNISGYINSEKGVGEGVRSDIRMMQAAEIPFVLNNLADPGSANQDFTFEHFSYGNPHPVNLMHINADELPEFTCRKGRAYFADRYNVGYWAWELSQFPEEWHSSVQHLDEIWVPSNFSRESIARAAPVPVVRIPHCLPEDLPTLALDRSHFGLPAEKFVFMYVFDFHSYMERKNPLGIIKAFQKAFRPDDNAVLIFKCSRPEFNATGFRVIKERARGLSFQTIERLMSRQEINTLIRLSDCYVSLHRSEGFGLTMAEAMSLEKPVIATNYSGNVDFMTAANSFPVNYRLIELDQDHGPYKKGNIWADPDVEHAAELMRFVYENRDKAKAVGRQAHHDMVRNFAPKVVGELVKERFAIAARQGKISSPSATAATTACSIIIPVFNKAALTRQCLDTLLSLPETEHAEIIVVDDGSTDDTPEVLAQYGQRIRAVRHETNSGFATACNDGAAAAAGEYLVFLNNDTIPKAGWLEALLNYAKTHPKAGVVGSKLLFPDDTIQHAGIVICQDRVPRHIYTGFPADHPAVNKSRPYQAVTGACLLIQRKLFQEVGGFDISFVNSCEDIDLCLRLAERGYEAHYCKDSVLYHLESVSRQGAPKKKTATIRSIAAAGESGRSRTTCSIFSKTAFFVSTTRRCIPCLSSSRRSWPCPGASRAKQAPKVCWNHAHSRC